MESGKKTDWKAINAKLPLERDAEGVKKRAKMFSDFDPNGNGYLSLAEVDKGVRDVLGLDSVFDCKPAIMRAFQAAKSSGPSRTSHSDDYIEKNEFRLFLVYLRQYFEYYEMFDRVDTGDDKKIDLKEFKTAVPLMEKWGVKVSDPEATFKEIDKNGGGQILFDEFCHWAIKKNLDLENDDDFEDKDLTSMK
jgi:Ca2+-binding EF-hand superfamily protein